MAEVYVPEPWEQQEGETSKAFEAFCVYRDLGPSRSVAKACRMLGKSKGTLERWTTKYQWTQRATAWDAEVARVKTQAHLEELKRMRDRHAQLGEKMVAVALQAMEELSSRPHRISGTAATQMAAEGTKIERLSRGDAGDVIEERDGGQAPFQPVQFWMPDNGRDPQDEEA